MNSLSFLHSGNHPIPKNCKFNELEISDDFTKIYKNKICIISLCNVPQNTNDCKLYNCTLEYKNEMILIKFTINNIIFEKLIYNGDKIPSRINFFKLLKRNFKQDKDLSDYFSDIFTYDVLNKPDTTSKFNTNILKYNSFDKYNNLKLFQKKNLLWMETVELQSNIDISYFKSSLIKIGNIYADIENNFFILPHGLENYVEKIIFKGGALIDSENSGKHKCMTIYCLHNTPIININTNSFNINEFKYKKQFLKIQCNLIITDYKNFNKWKTHLDEFSNNTKIIYIHTKNSLDKLKYVDIIDCKFVIISTKLLNNSTQYDDLCDIFYFNKENICDNIYNLATEYFRQPDFISKKTPILSHFHWHRIIFDNCYDEINMQNNSFLNNIVKTLSSTYRWCICNNHLNFKKNSFRNVLALLTSDYCIPNNINLKDIIINYLFRYNRKSTIINDNITWLSFNAYENSLINNYKNNSELYLKKICNCMQINTKQEILMEKNITEIINILKSKNKYKINNKIFLEDIKNEKCCICLENKDKDNETLCILNCGHSFCFSCILNTTIHSNKCQNKCPTCRTNFNFNSLNLMDNLKNIDNINFQNIYGTKINHLFKNFILSKKYKNKKYIIVSQYEDILEKINEILKKTNYTTELIIKQDYHQKIYNNDVILLLFTLEKLPIFENISDIIFFDPLYNDPLKLQEKNIISSVSNPDICVNKLYMRDSPEEKVFKNI